MAALQPNFGMVPLVFGQSEKSERTTGKNLDAILVPTGVSEREILSRSIPALRD